MKMVAPGHTHTYARTHTHTAERGVLILTVHGDVTGSVTNSH